MATATALRHRALVLLRDGRAFEGSVELGEQFVRIDGWLRVHHAGQVIRSAPGERCWPWSAIREVRSTEREELAA